MAHILKGSHRPPAQFRCASYLRSRHGEPWPDSITSNLPSANAVLMSSLMSATRFARIVNSLYVTSFNAGRELAQRTTFTPATTALSASYMTEKYVYYLITATKVNFMGTQHYMELIFLGEK